MSLFYMFSEFYGFSSMLVFCVLLARDLNSGIMIVLFLISMKKEKIMSGAFIIVSAA